MGFFFAKVRACESIKTKIHMADREASKATLSSFPFFDKYLRADEGSEISARDRVAIGTDIRRVCWQSGDQNLILLTLDMIYLMHLTLSLFLLDSLMVALLFVCDIIKR